MADELFDGNVASEMTLGEAIVRGILNPPKYVLSIYQYQKELEKYEHRIHHAKSKAVRDTAETYLEALRRALNQADGITEIFNKHIPNRSGKYIVFCANVEHMDEMITHVGEWLGDIDKEPHVYRAYSDDPETSKAFADFKKDTSEHLKLLYCIDMLNEGIHIEDISGVILLRPTVSPIIYKQQIGRALSASKTTTPVIFDIVMNIDNLYSIGTIQDEMQVVMTYYHERGLDNEIVNDRFKVYGEVKDCVQLFEKLNDTLTASWDYMYAEAKAYYKQHDNLEVPMRYKTDKGYSLGRWLFTQRKVREGEQFGILGEDRIKLLDDIGMVWDNYRDVAWNRYFEAAKAYYTEHGDLQVPALYTQNGVKLGAWISSLRTYKKNDLQSNYLTDERVKLLNSIGMVWEVYDSIWERNYNAAKRYYAANGNLDVPLDYVSDDGIKLGIWLNNLRSTYKGNANYRLTAEQINSLNAIGMQWNSKFERAWEQGFTEAKKYYESYGNLQVAAAYIAPNGFMLGKWIERQRANDKLSKERYERLNTIGMVWQKPNSWETRFSLAEQYYREHGNLKVPQKYIVDGIWLNKWLNEQKQIYNGKRGTKRLSLDQIQRLESIGMVWQSQTRA
jgi:hypothetical protein